ncbi:MAG: hypothetical protein SH868_11225 [Bythopirellula sp.]|nr:hypothetical protein [Bythopirellula sp.]
MNAALIGSIGLSYAGEFNVANDTVGDVKYASSLFETSPAKAIQNDGNLQLASYSSRSSGSSLGNWLDNTVVFTGADTYKSIGDRVTNIAGGPGALSSSYGTVTGFNTGFALGDSGLRGQVGASYGVYDFRGRLAIVPDSTNVEEQGFFTAGVYKRGDMASDNDPLSYGVVVDAFAADNWGINANQIDVGQARGMVGYALSERFEVGGFGTADLWNDDAAITVAGAPGVRSEVRAANQFNSYIRGNTPSGGSLMAYAGVFDQSNVQAWQFGATGEAPLSSWFSLYGNCNYAVPSAGAGAGGSGEEQFNIQFGLAYYFGGKAVSRSVTGQKGLPLFDVASNSSFLITD